MLIQLGKKLYDEYSEVICLYYSSICRRYMITLKPVGESVNTDQLVFLIKGDFCPHEDLVTEEGFEEEFNPIKYEEVKNDGT